MPPIPYTVSVRDHPGSSWEDIQKEPQWGAGHNHHVGFRNNQSRIAGLTHADDDSDQSDEEAENAKQKLEGLWKKAKEGDLLNFRDIISNEKDFHLRHPENRSLAWRYVLETSEDWVRNSQEWPANIRKQQKEEKAQEQGANVENTKDHAGDQEKPQQEHEWKREQGERKHHDAYAEEKDESDDESQEDEDQTRAQYTPHELALLRCLQHEKDYIKNLEQNDGKRSSPQTKNRSQISIDEADQFSPDNWIPRSSDLIRLTGKHPLNAEAHLTHLFEAGLITPNELHYVRNHGAVPHLLWEFHKLDVENGKLVLSMDSLKNDFDTINIPVALACDGNRRKELNMIKRSKGFNWGAGAVSCAYWKGPLLRDVLVAAGAPDTFSSHTGERLWVNFEGADEPSEGKYATCIPLQYAMDATNDVILAYEMNNIPLPPDHGYPVRLIIPGYVGGRCVKWLHKIWISDHENESHYHIWDNRVLPSFISKKDGEFAEAMFHHPDTACNEQNLNSVIVKPAHGEKVQLSEAKKGRSYRMAGYAYDGGGHEVQRVEVSLDDGETWLYCIRKFPDAPIRHGNKFWSWCHWHVDVDITHLLRAKNLSVRCFNVFKNTQPREPSWNIMGMMNNCWYVVIPEIVQDEDDDGAAMLYRHPVEPGTGDEGWMKASLENQIASAKQEAGTPQKQFTRAEIEKHDNEESPWIVVDNKVYDTSSVLKWHPGGKAAILGHAGKVHQATTDEFASIHDDYAYQKLKECILGVVTDKAKDFIKKNAEAEAREVSNSGQGSEQLVLQKHRWVPVKLLDRKPISEDTRAYTFGLPDGKKNLGLGTCQHVQIGFHLKDKMLIRSYTPTKPLLPAAEGNPGEGNNSTNHGEGGDDDEMKDGKGTFELSVKTYFPSEDQPGGAMSNILDCMPIGEEVEIRGPTGEIVYHGNGSFSIEGKDVTFDNVSLVLGGSGVTPGYSLIARILLSGHDKTPIRVVDANKSEQDILLRDNLAKFEQESRGQLKVTHVLSHPAGEWDGLTGHVNAEIIKAKLFPPGERSVVFLCGPPAMIQKAALPALKDWGYAEDENMFGF